MSFSFYKRLLVPLDLVTIRTNIRAEASLGDYISVRTNYFECDGIGNDGGATVGDISEWTCVYKDGRAFQCLHQRRLNRVLEKNSQRSCHPLYKRHYENIIYTWATKIQGTIPYIVICLSVSMLNSEIVTYYKVTRTLKYIIKNLTFIH